MIESTPIEINILNTWEDFYLEPQGFSISGPYYEVPFLQLMISLRRHLANLNLTFIFLKEVSNRDLDK